MDRGRKVLSRLNKGITITIYGLIVLMLFIVLISFHTDKVKDRTFMGYRFFNILSDSMKPKFEAGDLIFTKKVDPTTLEVGDIITFYFRDGTVVTHQIHEITTIDTNEAFITKGVNVNEIDPEPVYHHQVIGKYSFSIPKAGLFIEFMRSTWGYVLFIALPFLTLIGMNFYHLLTIIKKMREQKRSLQIEQLNALEEERRKNQQMLEELERLKQQIASGNNG